MTYTKTNRRYPDLLAGPPDAASERLVAQLDTMGQRFAQAPLAAARDEQIAQALRERALASPTPLARGHGRGWRGLSLARRAALLAVAALTTIALLTGATLAFGGPLFPWNYAFLQMFGQGPQAQTVNLSSSACGYTLRIRRVYADANVFIVGYAFTKPDGSFVGAGMLAPVVTDASGVALPMSDYGGGVNLGGSIGNLEYQSFDTGGVQGQPATLNLHMVVPAMSFEHGTPAPSPCSRPATASELGEPTPAPATPTPGTTAPNFYQPAIQGPFVFDVSVAYHGGRQLRTPITATQHGRTLTLERVVSTPLETQFYVSGAAMNAFPTLTVGGRTLDAAEGGPEGNLMVYKFAGSLYTVHGKWTLVIHSNNDSSGLVPQALPPGAWSFTFTMP